VPPIAELSLPSFLYVVIHFLLALRGAPAIMASVVSISVRRVLQLGCGSAGLVVAVDVVDLAVPPATTPWVARH
jgi:hypothetical protein